MTIRGFGKREAGKLNAEDGRQDGAITSACDSRGRASEKRTGTTGDTGYERYIEQRRDTHTAGLNRASFNHGTSISTFAEGDQ
jgi:hypothetical protein